MSTDEDYGPCYHCGTLTDSYACSSACARALDAEKAHPCERCGVACDCGEMPDACETCEACQEGEA